MNKHALRKGIGLLLLTNLLPLTGCLVYHNDVRYGDKGKAPTERTLDQVQTGTTTRDWVLATLGEPSRQSTTNDGTEVLEYQYSRKKDNSLVVCPFVFINDEGEETQTLYFEIEDGIVTKFWKETSKT
jgi:outer membrane protein assembly factor BamE (lipoprotein component of BamABCDE complex)